jgi:hypothetical protein
MSNSKLTRLERMGFIRVGRTMGLTYASLAKSLGISRQRVHQICKIYGIKKGEKNGRCEVDKTCHKHI